MFNALHLTQVQIAGSLITAIPAEIGKVTRRTLSIASRVIALIDLSQCVNIEKAVFAKNQIAALPKEIGQLTRLQFLDVSFNQLSALPETIQLLEQLQYAIIHLVVARC